MARQVRRSDEEWKQKLDPEAYRVLRRRGTEPPFTGRYHDHREDGIYTCAGCGTPLFSSEAKFHSGSGWPSFTAPVSQGAAETRPDHSHGMHRTEVLCAACGGHLGHVFDDGPRPSGKRYCINSAALQFTKKRENVD
ncbi:MAG: peptide-methionine (R)-S-oxide reductase MsrB [Candidatus Thermoplasmatota archaeon]|nr:peptide-methionine (R)-S-oxide reductase MsrB [Candidatus Thermoplasmatota archaeon]